jgi:hypothetical protein
MVSTAMQGGCTCENAAYLRINQGNIDIAAAIAPRPLGLIAADDWTKELQTKGYPDLAALYKMLDCPDRFEAHFHLQFPHNYNAVNRQHMYSFMNRHLKLGLPEPIVERDYIPLDTATEATVWTKQHPKPIGDQVGPAHERRLTAEWTKATEAALQGLDNDGRRKIVVEGLATIVGRTPDEVGPLKFDVTRAVEDKEYLVRIGKLTAAKHGEQLPTVLVEPKQDRKARAVIWLADGGKADLFAPDGGAIDAVVRLIRDGYTVASIDMFGQGEFVTSGKSIDAQRMVPGGKGSKSGQNPACYSFGYNSPLAVQRIHDVMSLAAFLNGGERRFKPDQIGLIAIGEQAGSVGLLARNMLADRIHRAAIDTAGFDFRHISRLNDPMFFPGILRYGGLDGIWEVASRRETVKVRGTKEATNLFSHGE